VPEQSVPENQDTLGPQILKAPEPTWIKIKRLLGVETREEAAALVQTDPDARKVVVNLLGGADNTVLTNPRNRAESFLTSPKREATPLSELMYGKGKAKVTF